MSFAVAGAFFLVWLYRARVNAESMAPRTLRLSRGWTIEGWFVPVGNIVLAPLALADVWHASSPAPTRRAFPVIGWAACALIAIVLNYTAFGAGALAPDPSGIFAAFVLWHGLEASFDIAAATLSVLIIIRVSRWQTTPPAAPRTPPSSAASSR